MIYIKKYITRVCKYFLFFVDFYISKSIVKDQNRDLTKIPVIIVNFNQLSYLEELINYLFECQFKNIVVIDNNSTYTPLLEFYKENEKRIRIYRLDKNYGHMVFWEKQKLFKKYSLGYYVISDPDIIPIKECPKDFMKYFKEMLDINPQLTKVGFNLKIDDIPDANLNKNKILKWESKFWTQVDVFGNFIAPIDTTFALYRPNYKFAYSTFYNSLRAKNPYQCIHKSWYIDNENLTQEQRYYNETSNSSNSWKMDENGVLLNINLYK